MAKGKSRTKKSCTLVEYLDAEDSAKKRSIFEDTKAEDTRIRGASDDEDSAGSQDDEDISMKKQGSRTVYDRNPAKREHWDPEDPAYTTKRKPRNIYTHKGGDYSYKEKQSKRRDAGDDAPDPNNDSFEDKEEKVTNPDDAWSFFQSVCKLNPKCI